MGGRVELDLLLEELLSLALQLVRDDVAVVLVLELKGVGLLSSYFCFLTGFLEPVRKSWLALVPQLVLVPDSRLGRGDENLDLRLIVLLIVMLYPLLGLVLPL